MTNPTCSKCNGEMKYVNPGISKQGKPYPGFYSCKVFTCDGTFNPPKNAPQTQQTPQMAQSPAQPSFVPPQAPSGSSQRIIELLESIDAKLEEIRYNSLKDPSTGQKIPF